MLLYVALDNNLRKNGLGMFYPTPVRRIVLLVNNSVLLRIPRFHSAYQYICLLVSIGGGGVVW